MEKEPSREEQQARISVQLWTSQLRSYMSPRFKSNQIFEEHSFKIGSISVAVLR